MVSNKCSWSRCADVSLLPKVCLPEINCTLLRMETSVTSQAGIEDTDAAVWCWPVFIEEIHDGVLILSLCSELLSNPIVARRELSQVHPASAL